MRTDESAMAGEDLGVAGYGGALIWDDDVQQLWERLRTELARG